VNIFNQFAYNWVLFVQFEYIIKWDGSNGHSEQYTCSSGQNGWKESAGVAGAVFSSTAVGSIKDNANRLGKMYERMVAFRNRGPKLIVVHHKKNMLPPIMTIWLFIVFKTQWTGKDQLLQNEFLHRQMRQNSNGGCTMLTP